MRISSSFALAMCLALTFARPHPRSRVCTATKVSKSSNTALPVNPAQMTTAVASSTFVSATSYISTTAITNGTTVASNTTVIGTLSGDSATAILVPMYIYPAAGAWDVLFTSIASNPTVTFRIIINPSSGPGGATPDASYTAAITKLTTYKNVHMIGYVRVNYTLRDIAEVQNDIKSYSAWPTALAMHGIFFDEAPNAIKANELTYMTTVTDLARKSFTSSYIVLNPGTSADSKFYAIADSIALFENDAGQVSATKTQAPSGIQSKQAAVIIYNAAGNTQADLVTSLVKTQKVGDIFITDTSGYISMSSSWAQFVSSVALALA